MDRLCVLDPQCLSWIHCVYLVSVKSSLETAAFQETCIPGPAGVEGGGGSPTLEKDIVFSRWVQPPSSLSLW